MPNIKLKTSTTPGAQPSGLVAGEIAINSADGKVYIGDAGGSTVTLIGTAAKYSTSSVNFTGGNVQGTTVGQSNPGTVTTNNLQVNGGQVLSGISTSTSLGSSDSVAPTEAAVKTYITNNFEGTLKNIFTYTSGTNTYTKSGSDVKKLRVIVVGGGGGGRGYAESGGAGGFAEEILDASGITSVTVTIGGGGTGGRYYGYSPGGGTTSFGSYVSATGGGGANNNQNHTGGTGGLGSGGNINSYGGGGKGHNNCHSASYHNSHNGGGVSYFGGPQASYHYTAVSSDFSAPGSGGTGSNWYNNGNDNYDRGRAGKPGMCIVYEYK